MSDLADYLKGNKLLNARIGQLVDDFASETSSELERIKEALCVKQPFQTPMHTLLDNLMAKGRLKN